MGEQALTTDPAEPGDALPLALTVQYLLTIPSPYNPRRIEPGEFEALRLSLRTFGAVESVVVNLRTVQGDGPRIVGGHMRVLAADAEGMAVFPVTWVDLDDVMERSLNLALNRIRGMWDDAKLQAVIVELESAGADLGLTGFTDDDVSRILAGDRGSGTGGASSGPSALARIVVECPTDLADRVRQCLASSLLAGGFDSVLVKDC